MNRTNGRRPRLHLLLMLAAMALPPSVGGCDTLGTQLCGADVYAQVNSLAGAATALQARAGLLEGRVLTACQNIAQDLTGTRPTPTGSLDEQVQSACTTAQNAITTAAASAQLSYAIAPPRCSIDAQAQLTCEATCNVSGSCSPGTVEVRCAPGDLSVLCSGMCQANAVCEATATAPTVNCDGTCQGVCTGSCSGSTNAAGECTGTCTGTCTGNCTVRPGSAGVSCGANARCRGGCSVTGTAPQCEADLMAPTCNVDADCQAGCQAQASFAATCDPATINVAGAAGATALVATLETNLPALLEVRDGLSAFVTDATDLVTASQSVAASVSAIPACAAASVTQIVGTAQSAATALASVQVTVNVSVSVTASAGTPLP